MKRYRLTQTLLNAFLYIHSVSEEYLEQAYSDFVKTLRRERGETTEAMQRGIDFEDEVRDYVKPIPCRKEFGQTVAEISKIVQGSFWQVEEFRDIVIDGQKYLMHAKLDCLKQGHIYDIKRVSKYDVGKYKSSAQHHVYLYVIDGAKEFTYLVSDGKDLYKESYLPDGGAELENIIRRFVKFLHTEDLWKIYVDKWGGA